MYLIQEQINLEDVNYSQELNGSGVIYNPIKCISKSY